MQIDVNPRRENMERTIIAVSGVSGQGKTQTLVRLAKHFAFRVEGFETGETCTQDDVPFADNADYAIDALLIGTYRGLKIGICSQGDPYSHQAEWLDKCLSTGCDIIVAACRTKGYTKLNVEETARKGGYGIIWVSTFCHESKEEKSASPEMYEGVNLNQFMAETLKRLIDSLISGRLS